MFAFSVVPPEVVGGLGDLPPEHRGEVQHLHVRLHLDRLQGVYMYLEVRVVKGSGRIKESK